MKKKFNGTNPVTGKKSVCYEEDDIDLVKFPGDWEFPKNRVQDLKDLEESTDEFYSTRDTSKKKTSCRSSY